ncbi:hypothetical protein TraAM80_08859 [Trypanosoma rangeli]|uniref:Uncharacterized protein n=1 Tax=Trypanosoma rangeli TaxID=5698 RepID=A0A3R7KP21_TRYRA|nr:uncharacterized protein TraAM80_08859 [Trypanosoma rangeli]RNE98497.1 hypothetical protein TraAM80_08859 [Trypanosoma rangeli]|eukprot:RNE98497.1 hypothetical protein TraAM80_08859 [Trypanosoma rangeli]
MVAGFSLHPHGVTLHMATPHHEDLMRVCVALRGGGGCLRRTFVGRHPPVRQGDAPSRLRPCLVLPLPRGGSATRQARVLSCELPCFERGAVWLAATPGRGGHSCLSGGGVSGVCGSALDTNRGCCDVCTSAGGGPNGTRAGCCCCCDEWCVCWPMERMMLQGRILRCVHAHAHFLFLLPLPCA